MCERGTHVLPAARVSGAALSRGFAKGSRFCVSGCQTNATTFFAPVPHSSPMSAPPSHSLRHGPPAPVLRCFKISAQPFLMTSPQTFPRYSPWPLSRSQFFATPFKCNLDRSSFVCENLSTHAGIERCFLKGIDANTLCIGCLLASSCPPRVRITGARHRPVYMYMGIGMHMRVHGTHWPCPWSPKMKWTLVGGDSHL